MLHKPQCAHCGKPNLYYDETLKVNQESQAEMVAHLTKRADTIPAASRATEGVKDESSAEMFETRWRCWRCRKIYPMIDKCAACDVEVTDYAGETFNAILVEVSVAKENQHRETPPALETTQELGELGDKNRQVLEEANGTSNVQSSPSLSDRDIAVNLAREDGAPGEEVKIEDN